MKDFSDFKSYVSNHSDEIHFSIHQKVLNVVNEKTFCEAGEEHEFYRRAWVEIGIMEMLEHYHNWLSS